MSTCPSWSLKRDARLERDSIFTSAPSPRPKTEGLDQSQKSAKLKRRDRHQQIPNPRDQKRLGQLSLSVKRKKG